MRINFVDKISLILKIYSVLHKLPLKAALKTFLKPADSIRYWEFNYLLKYLKKIKLNKGMKVLDVSSPFILSYILSKKNNVLKTDINNFESQHIKENKNLKFKLEDATCLSFKDDAFDLVYSVSVIEHIYERYLKAVQEMVRVTKPKGLIYLSFPVSKSFVEEWIDEKIYSDQYEKEGQTFFQYRFDEVHYNSLLRNLENCEILIQSIYKENIEGGYDKLIKKIRCSGGSELSKYLKSSMLNLIAGFTLLDKNNSDFENIGLYGNLSVIIRKFS